MEQLNNTPMLAGVAGVVLVGAAVMMCAGGGSSVDMKEEPKVVENSSKKVAVNQKKEPTEEKKPKKKDKKKGGDSAAPAAAPAVSKPAPTAAVAAPEQQEKQQAPSKKQQNKKKGGGGGNAKKPKPPAVVEEASVLAAAELAAEEEAAAKAAASKKAKAAKPSAVAMSGDGWTAVDAGSSKKDKKAAKAAAAAAEEAKASAEAAAKASAARAVIGMAGAVSVSTAQSGGAGANNNNTEEAKPQMPSSTMLVDPRKLGILIGPKGATLKRIEEVSGCRVQLPERGEVEGNTHIKSISVSITGPDPMAVKAAEKLVLEMCSKGYSAGLDDKGDFKEAVVEVHPRYLPDIVGSGGNTVKALRDACGVHVNLPANKKGQQDTESESKPVKVTIAGPKEGVAKAVKAVQDIVALYYSPVTHPGMTHAEFKVEEWQIARFCGKGGSNVRHIQGDSRARVFVPREWAKNKNVVVVGYPAQVDVAKKHVARILQDIAEMADRISSAEGMAAAHRANKDGNHYEDEEQEEPIEDWMREYMYKR